MIFINGSGGASEERKILKFLWVVGFLKTVSKKPSRPFKPSHQLYIRCKF
jgi:hypothetical protein